MTAPITDLVTVQNDILFAIRAGTFPASFNDKGYDSATQIAAGLALAKKGYIVGVKPGISETGRGDNFVLQQPDFSVMPEMLELTLDGERFVDWKLGVDSTQLEKTAKIAFLQILSKGAVRESSTVQMPDGIGPHRQAYLRKEISMDGWTAYEPLRESQGTFTREITYVKITPAGALKLAEMTVEPDNLGEMIRLAHRQMLLRILSAGKQTGGQMQEGVKTKLPGWGGPLCEALAKDLVNAGLLWRDTIRMSQGFFTRELLAYALTDRSSATLVAVTHAASVVGMGNLRSSGREIANRILERPELSFEIEYPKAREGSAAKTLAL